MSNSYTLFSIVMFVLMGLALFYLQTRVVISNRRLYDHTKQISKEREATAAILGLAQNAISTDISDEAFLSSFIEYAQRTLLGNGAAVLVVQGDGSLKGVAVSGIFPPMKEVPFQVEQQLLAHAKKHTEFFRELKLSLTADDLDNICRPNGYAFVHDEFPPHFPKNFSKSAPRMALAPISIKSRTFAFVMVVSRDEFDEHSINEDDAKYLLRLNEIAAMTIEGIKVFRERTEYEKQVQTAREEGMLQVSAGIIHNIGNAVTVAKLTVLEMKEKFPDSQETPEELIAKVILPKMEQKILENTIQDFLTKDKTGSQYFNIMKELLQHIQSRSRQMIDLLKSISDKLYHISEIIELQQRFVGELGTENMTSLSSVVESAVKIFEETCNKHGVKIDVDTRPGLPEVLIDTSMMTQVFMNLIKNSVEAMESEKVQKQHSIRISITEEKLQEKKYVIAKVSDNGPGIPEQILGRLFEFGFSTKEKSRHSRGYGLHSCKDTVKKYNGNITVESKVGEGTTFTIMLPVSGDVK